MSVLWIDRPIAITDVETTGLDFRQHEIVDVGLVLVDQRTLAVIDTYWTRVKPVLLVTATQKALEVNGYNEKDWENAKPLLNAMVEYTGKTANSIFCAHNVTFDWGFVEAALRRTGVDSLMDYHRIDLFTMAWLRLKDKGIKKLGLNYIAEFLGIQPEPEPHTAMNGAMLGYEVFKRLVVMTA